MFRAGRGGACMRESTGDLLKQQSVRWRSRWPEEAPHAAKTLFVFLLNLSSVTLNAAL